MTTLKATLVTADTELLFGLEPLSGYRLIEATATLQPDAVTRRSRRGDAARARPARRWLVLHQEAKDQSRQLSLLARQAAQQLARVLGAGCGIAAQMRTTVGGNRSWIECEAAFARMRGARSLRAHHCCCGRLSE